MKTTILLLATLSGLIAIEPVGAVDGPIEPAGSPAKPSYNCGPLAVLELGRHVQPSNSALNTLANMEALAPGFSMRQLAQLSQPLGLDLVPVRLGAHDELPLPAVALLNGRHYVTVFPASDGACRVWDPLGRKSVTAPPALVLKASGGLFLVPRAWVREGHGLLGESESRLRFGGYVSDGEPPNDLGDEACPDDTFENTPKCPTEDCECFTGTQDGTGDAQCSDCSSADTAPGLAIWRVREPTVNLWIIDTPLFYTTSQDDWITFRLVYKQRNTHTNAYVYGVGPWWECNWRSYLIPDGAVQGKVQRRSGGGGEQNFVADGQTREFYTGGKMPAFAEGRGYALENRRGASMTFDATNFQAGVSHYFPSFRVDARGRTNRFQYEISTNGVIRLTALIDSDGKRNGIGYGNPNFPNLITTITNPYSRTISLTYDNLGRLTNITDMAGLTSGFAYDEQGLITNMATGYGVTSFTCTTNEPTMGLGYGEANVVNRSVRVVEPNGANHLFVHRRFADQLNPTNNTPLLPDSYPESEVPDTGDLSNTFDNVQMSQRNTFYWGPRQYALLSTNFLANPTNFNALTTNDYRFARIKHWLAAERDGSTKVSPCLSMLRKPSPDGSTDGAKTWLDYEGKLHVHNEGTHARPRLIARVLPDGSSSFRYIERSNSWENPTMVIQSWSSNDATVLLRTNLIRYEDDEKRIRSIVALRGATEQLIVGFGDYLNNLPQRITNAAQQVTTIVYDPTNRQIVRIQRAGGLVTTNRYFTSGAFTNWLEWTADYAVENGTNVLFHTNSFTYLNGLVRTATDTRGHTRTLTWDNLERLTQATLTNGSYSFAYNLLDLSSRTDRLGRTESFGHDSMRRLTWHIGPRGYTNTWNYCDCGSLESAVDPDGRQTAFLYDHAGRLSQTVYPGNVSYAFGYDDAGRLTEVTDGNGQTTTRFFNNQGLVTAVSNQVGLVYVMTPNIDDLPARFTTAEGVTITNTFDALGRILTRRAPDGGQETFTYNVRGLTNWTAPGANGTLFTLNAAGRVVRQQRVNPIGTVFETIRFEYARSGDLLKLWDGADHLTQWTYDTLGRARTKVNASNITEFTWNYDAEDRLTTRTDALNRTTDYGYDAAGNLTSVTYAGTNTADLTMTYDALDRLETLVDGVGTTAFSYAANGRLRSEDGPWADDTVSYLYNVVGLRQRVSVPRGGALWSADYAYDAARRLTNLVSGAGSFTNQFLAGLGGFAGAGRLLEKVSFSGGTVATNRFDPVGRLLETTLRRSGGTLLEQWQYGYELDSLMKGATNGFGARWGYGHDALGQLKTATGKTSEGVSRLHEQLSYSYDAAGNLTNRLKNALNQGFAADALNQLTSASRSGTLTVAGTTGVASTNTSVTINGNAASVYADGAFARAGFTVTNGVNSFTAVGTDSLGRSSTNTVTVTLPATVTFSYDAKGNLLGDGQRVFLFDDENQLVTVYVTNAWKAGFAYDGFGRRREKTESVWSGGAWATNLVVRYVYDGMLVLQERHFNPGFSMQTPVEAVTYTRGLDLSGSLQGAGGIGGLLARTDSKGTVYYQTDGRGNVTALFNASGALVARYAYDPFGNTLAASGPMAEANVYRFSSKEIHPGSGLCYYGFRFYDPSLQRWINRDPIGEGGGVNLHNFVGNSPLLNVDPQGLVWPFDISQEEWDRVNRQHGSKPYNQDELVDYACKGVGRAGGLITPAMSAEAAGLTKDVGKAALDAAMIAPLGPEEAAAALLLQKLKGLFKWCKAAKTAPKLLNQFNSAESLIQNAGSLTRLKGGVKMGTVTGDGEAIFKAISNGGQTLPSGYVKMADGTIIGKHIAGSTGQFTIDVNQAGQIFKIRVNP